jgi:hypothetical protein
MTEHEKNQRIDLRAVAPSSAQADRVIGATMSRVRKTPQLPSDTLANLAEPFIRPALISAALLAAAAACTIVLIEPRERFEQSFSPLADWIESQHVPSNSELLLAFQGYGEER